MEEKTDPLVNSVNQAGFLCLHPSWPAPGSWGWMPSGQLNPQASELVSQGRYQVLGGPVLRPAMTCGVPG